MSTDLKSVAFVAGLGLIAVLATAPVTAPRGAPNTVHATAPQVDLAAN